MADAPELDQKPASIIDKLDRIIEYNPTLDPSKEKQTPTNPHDRAATSKAYSEQPRHVSVSGKINPQGRKTW